MKANLSIKSMRSQTDTKIYPVTKSFNEVAPDNYYVFVFTLGYLFLILDSKRFPNINK